MPLNAVIIVGFYEIYQYINGFLNIISNQPFKYDATSKS